MFHLGTARTALFCYIIAKASGGKFILRIDDTDLARNTPEAEAVIHDALAWLGLTPDAIFKQSDRFDLYRNAANDLVKAGKARIVDGGAIALNTPATMPTSWADTIAGTIPITDTDLKLIDGLILIRSDGNPTYHFASIFDDATMDIDGIVRGNDHTNNTPKQIAILTALAEIGLNIRPISFTHLGLIMIKDDAGKRKKMSKRDAASSLLDFRDRGVPASAMIQFMLRLGWSASDPNFDKTHKYITLDDAVGLFADGRMGNSPVLFDADKLDNLTRLHVRRAGA